VLKPLSQCLSNTVKRLFKLDSQSSLNFKKKSLNHSWELALGHGFDRRSVTNHACSDGRTSNSANTACSIAHGDNCLTVLKTVRRHLENLWLRTHSPHHLKLRTASNKYHSAIIAAKKRFNASFIASSSSNPCKLWNSIILSLNVSPTPLLPSLASSQSLSQMFATFFSDKILKLHTALKSSSTISLLHIHANTPTILSAFSLISEDEVSKIISQVI